jgi:hypothetical protein
VYIFALLQKYESLSFAFAFFDARGNVHMAAGCGGNRGGRYRGDRKQICRGEVQTMNRLLVSLPLVLACSLAWADEAVQQRIDALEQELDALKEEVSSGEDDAQDVYGMEFESAAATPEEGRSAIGGYGEINYNNYKDDSKRDEFDVQRFILFLGHRFNERTRLYSEIEFEHSVTKGGDSSSGEVAMEQAYIEHGLTKDNAVNLRAGLMLLPIGIINEYHEPPTFYGVERNEVESRIIPSTWREIGLALQGRTIGGLEYNGGISTTPDASKFSDASSGFKDMRVKGNRVTANEFGFFAGLNYRGVPGLLLGAGLWTGNTAQEGQGKGEGASSLAGYDAKLTVWDVHARYSVAGFDLRALYAKGSLSDTAAINAAANDGAGLASPDDAAPESFSGWFVEAAYHIYRSGNTDIAPFIRYEDYNTQESVASGFSINPNNDEQVITAGVNFYVHPQVVFKIDVQDYDTDDTKDRFNFGIGWMF